MLVDVCVCVTLSRRPLSATAVDLSGDFLKTQESIEDDLDLVSRP